MEEVEEEEEEEKEEEEEEEEEEVAPRSWAPIYEGLEEPYLGHFVMSRGIFVGIIMAAIDTLRSYRKLY
ncbi:hypothetical protein HZH68_007743 [Vespula germanica]|uniref:Uncharacterized protein n=1 Tax=Vespula germanica TaxID=30212 RepID=A0A834K885_VESGE|nr:hypothetical protein HZH68_007743 [Vespula germanica]